VAQSAVGGILSGSGGSDRRVRRRLLGQESQERPERLA